MSEYLLAVHQFTTHTDPRLLTDSSRTAPANTNSTTLKPRPGLNLS